MNTTLPRYPRLPGSPSARPVRSGPSETEKVRAYFAERLAGPPIISAPIGGARVLP